MRIGLDWIEWLVRHKNALIQSHCPHNASFCHRNDTREKKCDPMFNFPNSTVVLHRAPKKVCYDWKISNVNRSISNAIQFDSIQFDLTPKKVIAIVAQICPIWMIFFGRFISKAKWISIKVFRINRSISFDLRNVETNTAPNAAAAACFGQTKLKLIV